MAKKWMRARSLRPSGLGLPPGLKEGRTSGVTPAGESPRSRQSVDVALDMLLPLLKSSNGSVGKTAGNSLPLGPLA